MKTDLTHTHKRARAAGLSLHRCSSLAIRRSFIRDEHTTRSSLWRFLRQRDRSFSLQLLSRRGTSVKRMHAWSSSRVKRSSLFEGCTFPREASLQLHYRSIYLDLLFSRKRAWNVAARVWEAHVSLPRSISLAGCSTRHPAAWRFVRFIETTSARWRSVTRARCCHLGYQRDDHQRRRRYTRYFPVLSATETRENRLRGRPRATSRAGVWSRMIAMHLPVHAGDIFTTGCPMFNFKHQAECTSWILKERRTGVHFLPSHNISVHLTPPSRENDAERKLYDIWNYDLR